MKYWTYEEPGDDGEVVTHKLSEAEIIEQYYPYWQTQMKKVGKEDLINEANCIEDWVTVHWAWEINAKHD